MSSSRPEPHHGMVRGMRIGRASFLALALVLVSPPAAEAQSLGGVPQSREQISLTFAPVVRMAAPAVVSVTTRKAIEVRRDPFFDDPFFSYFFRDFGVPSRRERREQNSLGSGVIIRSDGLVVTNNHVIEGADEITVILNDRRELEAELVAADERSDLAFLKVVNNTGALPVLPVGDSDRLEVGDLVLAIGNPFGIGQTVTSGIISAKSRSTPGGQREVSFIQTDAAINPGNSGGALVSLSGELVGVNTAIFTRGGGSIGIGFAVPANLVKAQMLSIDTDGRVRRPWLGASIQPVDPGLAAALGLDRPVGVLVNELYPGGAADRAGLRRGDVILSVDGVEIFDGPGLNLRLALNPLGARVPVQRWRGGRVRKVGLETRSAPRKPDPDITRLEGRHPFEGLTVANMSPGLNEELGIDMLEGGVVVMEIPRRGFGARLRLRSGDAIASVNGTKVETVRQLEELTDREARRWEIEIRRGGETFTLTVS